MGVEFLMASITTSHPTEFLSQESTLAANQDLIEKTNMILDNNRDTLERIQQQLGIVTGLNLARNERVE